VLQHVLHVYAMNLGFAKRLVGDLSDDQMCAQPHGVVNHPAWSLGHLAVAADAAGAALGLGSELPAGWAETFKTGGTPSPDKSRFPKKDEILGVLAAQHARVAHALSTLDPAVLAAPGHEKRRAHFPTVGDFAIFLMTAHEMDHLGQIAAWRRAMGLGAPS
jgi:DinB family protein